MGRNLISLLIVLMLALAPCVPAPGTTDVDGNRGPGPMSDGSPWTDSFDDMGSVYTPPGGLVGVEVAGGEVRLLPGHDEGWVVSTVIACPTGFRYDLVLLEADIPGESSVEVSVLDPSSPPTSGDYANATASGFIDVEGTDVSLTRLDRDTYPNIRVQVRLVANGTDRPSMQAWTVYFGDIGEWRDDFLGTGKMKAITGINVTADTLSLDLSHIGSLYAEYDHYPPIMLEDDVDGDFFSCCPPNAGRTGYGNLKRISSTGQTNGFAFDDFDGDGLCDMVICKHAPNTPIDSEIRWGTGKEEWSSSNKMRLKADGAHRAATGDFNGDGWRDLVIACTVESRYKQCIFMNKGTGISSTTFSRQPDIKIPVSLSQRADVGDLNNDGYDDIVFSSRDRHLTCFFGGRDGPDTNPDMYFESWWQGPSVLVRDLNKDGYLDVATGIRGTSPFDYKTVIYLGSPKGWDNSSDYSLRSHAGPIYDIDAGDINNDGYLDLAIMEIDDPNPNIYIYTGSAEGWNTSRVHSIQYKTYDVLVIDVNKDDFDDVVWADGTDFYVLLGGSTLPSTPTIHKSGLTGSPYDIQAAVPKVGSGGVRGSIVTEPITLPVDKKWDILDLDGTIPSNTSVILTILDSERKPITSFTGLTDMNLDLAGLEEHETIHVEVKLMSKSNTTTPVLDRLLVNWMDKWEWREEFYGVAKMAGREGLNVSSDELRRAQEVDGPEDGYYLSKAFGPEVTREADSFHTLRYTARLGSSQSGKIRLVDAVTLEVLAETPLRSGTQEWDLLGAFNLRGHPSIQINVTADGLDLVGEFALDDIWVNWTYRLNLPPTVLDIWPGEPTVERTKTVQLYVNVSDDYDTTHDLTVEVHHRLQSSGVWSIDLFHPTQREKCEDGLWIFYINPPYYAALGLYAFRVDVTDKDGIHSGFIEFAPMLEVVPNLPSEPYILIATAADSEVELEWRPPLDTGDSALTGYRIYRGRSNDSLDLLATVDSYTTTYLDIEVENGISYFYAVLAYSVHGNGILSRVVEARPVGPPSEPLSLTASFEGARVTLNWMAPEDDGGHPVVDYYVYKGPTLTRETTVTGTECTFTELTKGKTYHFAVSARNDLGEGPMSAVVSVTPVSLPSAPMDLAATASELEVTLTWHSPIDTGGLEISGFVIYRGEDSGSLEELKNIDGPSSMYFDNEVEGGVEYYYALAAVTAFGEGPKSEVVSAMPLGPPGIPRNLIVDAGDGQVSLIWSAPVMDGGSPVTTYEIMRGSSPDDLALYAQVLDTLSYLDDDVTNGQTYYYAVIAINDVGEGPPTEAVPVTPYRPPTVPGRVFSLTVEAKGGKVELTWAAPEDDGGSQLTGYVVLRGKTTDAMEVVITLDVVTSWSDEDVKRGTTYFYSVVALNEHGQGEPFDEVKVKVPKEEESPALGGVFVLLAMLVGMAACMMKRKDKL